tara:strand:- start:2155 stop:4893 length:2739 start_codon:yes stop_codon:yes gene_type:complete
MPGVFVGETKALVFPMLCDGYLNLDYSEYNDTDTDLALRAGVWSPRNVFTLEAILTPYDINGYGSHSTGFGTLDSRKTSPRLGATVSNPTHYQSNKRFGTSQNDKKMSIFYNTNLHLYLENATTTNINQPSEWKLVADFPQATNATRYVKTDNAVITSNNTLHGYYDSTGYYDGISTSLRQIGSSAQNALPFNTISIDSAFSANELDTSDAQATGSVTISGTPQSYYPAQNATASITAPNNNFSVDTYPVKEVGQVKFYSNPSHATPNSNSTDCILVTTEAGITYRWFAQSASQGFTGSSGDPLTGTWPANSFAYLIGTTNEDTAGEFYKGIGGNSSFWAGVISNPGADANPTLNPGNIVLTFTAAFTGSAPNRVGDTNASLAIGTTLASNSSIAVAQMAGGVDEVQVTNNFITITTGGSAKKYHPYPSGYFDASEVTVGTSVTRGSDTVFPFLKGSTLANTYTGLAQAINHSNGNTQITATTGSGSPLPLNLTVDAAGTTGNSYNITETNMTHVTVTNFSGGEAANEPSTKAIQLVDSDGTITKFLAAHATKSTNATGSTITFGNPSVTYVLYRLPSGGGSNRANFAAAVNSVSALDITASDDGSDQNKVNLTQGTAGVAGNTTITENLGVVTKVDFAGGSDASAPNEFIQITSPDGATVLKFKASNLGSQSTGSTSGDFTYFQIGGSTTAAASNLITAINNSSLGSKLTASSPSSNHEVKIQLSQAGGSYAISETYTNVSFGSWQTGNIRVVSGIDTTNIGVGEQIFNTSGESVGAVSTVDSTTQVTLSTDPTATVSSIVYASQPREALYVDSMYKVTLIYNDTTGRVELYLNNSLVKAANVSITDSNANGFKFEMDDSDCRIGQGADNTTQFYGELYEIAMSNKANPSITSTTLSPGQNDIIFYYRFDD